MKLFRCVLRRSHLRHGKQPLGDLPQLLGYLGRFGDDPAAKEDLALVFADHQRDQLATSQHGRTEGSFPLGQPGRRHLHHCARRHIVVQQPVIRFHAGRFAVEHVQRRGHLARVAADNDQLGAVEKAGHPMLGRLPFVLRPGVQRVVAMGRHIVVGQLLQEVQHPPPIDLGPNDHHAGQCLQLTAVEGHALHVLGRIHAERLADLLEFLLRCFPPDQDFADSLCRFGVP